MLDLEFSNCVAFVWGALELLHYESKKGRLETDVLVTQPSCLMWRELVRPGRLHRPHQKMGWKSPCKLTENEGKRTEKTLEMFALEHFIGDNNGTFWKPEVTERSMHWANDGHWNWSLELMTCLISKYWKDEKKSHSRQWKKEIVDLSLLCNVLWHFIGTHFLTIKEYNTTFWPRNLSKIEFFSVLSNGHHFETVSFYVAQALSSCLLLLSTLVTSMSGRIASICFYTCMCTCLHVYMLHIFYSLHIHPSDEYQELKIMDELVYLIGNNMKETKKSLKHSQFFRKHMRTSIFNPGWPQTHGPAVPASWGLGYRFSTPVGNTWQGRQYHCGSLGREFCTVLWMW